MKAIIFNSGLGNRMGDITKAIHKSMVELKNDENILHRQLRILGSLGIQDYIITVGPFEEQIRETAAEFQGYHFRFVRNDIYYRTNYIYSMFLARDFIDDDMLFLHGDLVFNKKFAEEFLDHSHPNLAPINSSCPQPKKDFKGRVQDGRLREVSVSIFDPECFALQPFYKLEKAAASAWTGKVTQFVIDGFTKCYAENALNEILPALDIRCFPYDGHFVEEIDTVEDYQRVSQAIAAFDEAEAADPDEISQSKNF